jgi:hypothetical protein
MDRHYIEVPGPETHELPPLLIRAAHGEISRESLVERAAGIVATEDMVQEAVTNEASADAAREMAAQRRLDLALHLTDRYLGLLLHWAWGDSVLEWIRQCEITFESTNTLRALLSPDIWPHAARSSFVDLLLDKHVTTGAVAIEKAVGTRLTFRQPPPIDCCSDQFLFFLSSRLAGTAYETWARMSPQPGAHLPPNRFHFEVHDLALLH